MKWPSDEDLVVLNNLANRIARSYGIEESPSLPGGPKDVGEDSLLWGMLEAYGVAIESLETGRLMIWPISTSRTESKNSAE